jgi:lipopolysaccharide biosynthesis regulator YciM
MSFSVSPDQASPEATSASEALALLRAESEAATDDASRAVLLHEVGVLEDNARNDGQAARDLLSAVNALPGFHEPLERLVSLFERRKSYKNLGKLVDRLAKVAETPEEQARALVALAEFREDQDGDIDAARESLERATQCKGDDRDAWLALEHLAAKVGDADLRRRALAARSDLAEDPTWRGLLSVDVAKLHTAAGDFDAALEAIERALATRSAVCYAALTELGHLGAAAGRPELSSRAHEARAGLIERALADPGDMEASGVPAGARSGAHVAEAWLLAADVHRQSGNPDRAVALMDQAVERLPQDSVALRLRLRAGEVAGDTTTAAALARRELAEGAQGPVAASLWMRVTEAAASSGDAAGALDALARALAEDPQCIPARTLTLDLLSGGGDPAALAQALEAAAEQLGSEPQAAKFFLLSAETWARGAGDVSAARAALSMAAASGASLEVVARTSRTLAALANDATWLDEATRRVLATNPPEDERPGLWFEVGRARLLRGDVAGASEAFASLAGVEGGAWLGNVLGAYALAPSAGQPAQARTAAALRALASLSPDGEMARAIRVGAALRYQQAGLLDEAIVELRDLHDGEPGDLVVATALATLERRKGNPLAAAEALARCATGAADPSVAGALELEAGILRWLSGDRTKALASFDAAAKATPDAASGLLAWALRAAQPNDAEARRKALDAARPYEDERVLALERFALEAGKAGDRAAATASLAAAVTTGGTVGTAVELSRALWTQGDPSSRRAALEALALRGPEARSVARGSLHFTSLGEKGGGARAKEASARAWSEADPSVASAVEWLAQAVAAQDVDEEIAAREALAARLTGSLASAVTASARLVARLAHDDVGSPLLTSADPAALLANLELAPPSCDPRRRAMALIGGASLLDEPSRAPAAALAGWNLLASGDAHGAIRAFRSYVDAHGEDIVGWEGLRAAAELSGNKPLLAEASAALGDLVSDAGQGAELWERAASILLDDLGDAANGERALSRAVERDVTLDGAFDRLFRIVRARRDGPRLLELVEVRLVVAEDPTEIAKLYWERARVLRESGNSVGALEALENVTLLEPDHVGALALTGEIYITEKRFAEAAESLARLALLDDAPAPQRLMSGIAAVDLYENRLGQLDRALEVLVGLHGSGHATLPVRERLARAAAKSAAWETATTVLEELMEQRESKEGRVEAARLAMAIHRDRLGAPARAERAVERLLLEVPDDGEALDLVLSGALAKTVTKPLLDRGKSATLATLIASPLDLERTSRLAEMARQSEDTQLRQVALGAVVALGGGSAPILAELEGLDGRVARTPQIAIDDRVVDGLRDPEDRGPISDLVRALASTIAEALGPGLAALAVTKKERVRPQDGVPLRNEVAAWIGALGLGEFEFYIGGRDADGVYAVATEVPSIVAGAAVAHPPTASHRAALARELLGLKLGTTILRHRDPTEVAALITAACNIGGVRIDSPPYAMLAEFERLLSKEVPRRVRKMLPELATAVARSGADPLAWVRAARSSLDRMAAISIGDVSWVLAGSDGGGRGDAPKTGEAKLRAARLLSFVLSPAFFAARDNLGMGVR